MKRLGFELAGALLGAAYWTLLVWFLYGQRYGALWVVCGSAVAVLLLARAARPGMGRISFGAVLGAVGGLLLLGAAVGGEKLHGGVGACVGGLVGYVAWRVGVAVMRRGPVRGVPTERRERWGTRLAEWAGLLGASAVGCIVLLYASGSFAGEVKLQGYDAIALVGERAHLSAKLEKQGVLGLNPDLHGVLLRFEVDWKPYGAAKTEEEGVAFIDIPFKEPGIHTVRVSIASDPKGRTGADVFTLLVMDKGQEWAPCDLDHTICDTDDLMFPFQENASIRIVPGAPSGLNEVAKRIQPVYITGRDDAFMSKTRAWIAANGFPKGPVFFMDWKLGQTDVEKFKGDTIESIARKNPNVHVGFGDLPTDARAYLRNKLTAYILRSKPPGEYPEGITPVGDWIEIARLLEASRR